MVSLGQWMEGVEKRTDPAKSLHVVKVPLGVARRPRSRSKYRFPSGASLFSASAGFFLLVVETTIESEFF